MKGGKNARSSELYLIRSYDHIQRNSPYHSTGPTPRTTIGSGRRDTGISINANGTLMGRRHTTTKPTINHEKAQQLEVWQVARAATAAKFYFEPLKVENARSEGFTEFTDGGFGQANNPTRTGKQEIEDLHGHASVGIVVSVGTARKLSQDAKKANYFSTIPNSAREFADTATDPEGIHNDMQRDYDSHHRFPYYRLNHPGGLQTELDEWKPKRKIYNRKEGGAKTIANMETAFSQWAEKHDNIELLKGCAAALVDRRRKRMSTGKWERFATGSHFECRFKGCDPGDFYDRHQFRTHLIETHELNEVELDDELGQSRKHWRYQAAPKQ